MGVTERLHRIDSKLKKQLLRAAIREILVEVDRENHRVEAKLHWWGGAHSLISIKKRIRPRGNKADPSMVDLVRQTAAELSDAEIARILNMKSLETPAGLRWTKDRVATFRYRHHIKAGRRRHDENYLTMKEAHAHLDISRNGLLGLVMMGGRVEDWRGDPKVSASSVSTLSGMTCPIELRP